MNRRVVASYAALLLTLFTLAVLVPAPIGNYADPTSPPDALNPHWYLRPLSALLQVVPEAVAWGAFLVIMGFLYTTVLLANARASAKPRLAWGSRLFMPRRMPRLSMAWLRRKRPQAPAETGPAAAVAVAQVTATAPDAAGTGSD